MPRGDRQNTSTGQRRSWPSRSALQVETVGPCERPSPIPSDGEPFVDERDRVLLCRTTTEIEPFLRAGEEPPSFEPGGARPRIAFDPATLACGVLTCGGICPGLNNVVRSIVLSLTYAYGVKRILGFRYGYAGLAAGSRHEPVLLTPKVVDTVHQQGGTVLGSSRGPQDVGGMVDTLERLGIGALFVLGGDGGLRGASAIHAEIRRRGKRIAVIGVPKTIDNDLQWTWRSFGFSTAVDAAQSVLEAAHTEARAAWNGVGLVKLMGRHAGFIAAHATLANSDVNFCLVPEVPLVLEGEHGFLRALERRLGERRHAVVVIAEGAGQDLAAAGRSVERDASGNVKLANVGVFLRERIKSHLAERKIDVSIRYFDPTYSIRSLPANPMDAQYCLTLGQNAVHAALAGRTDMVVCSWNDHPTHVPLPLVVERRRQLDPNGEDWQRVIEATGQRALIPSSAPPVVDQ